MTKKKTDWTTRNTRFTEARRFGIRIDTMTKKKWQLYKKVQYNADMLKLKNIKKRNKLAEIISRDIFNDICRDYKGHIIYHRDLRAENYTAYKQMRGIVRDWNEALSTFGGQKNKMEISFDGVIKRIKKLIAKPKETLPYYGYIQAKYKKEADFNKKCLSHFNGIKKMLEQNRKKYTSNNNLLGL